MTKDVHSDLAATADLDLQLTDQEQLQLDIAISFTQFKEDPSNAFLPFWALSRIYAFHVVQEELVDQINVPTWIVEALFGGFMIYRDTIADGSNKSFGEAFGLEGGGQGRLPAAREHEAFLRNIRICIKIALLEEQGIKIEAALQEAADTAGRSPTTIRDIWAKHSERARRCLENLRNGHHS